MDQAIPPEILRRLTSWNRVAVLLRVTHLALGAIGVICPLVVASFADRLETWQLRVLSFLASAAIAIFRVVRDWSSNDAL